MYSDGFVVSNTYFVTNMKDLEWFKKEVVPYLTDYEIQYRFYSEGDFGTLTQANFNSKRKGGGIDFWGLGWLGVDLYDYEKDTKELVKQYEFEGKDNTETEKCKSCKECDYYKGCSYSNISINELLEKKKERQLKDEQ